MNLKPIGAEKFTILGEVFAADRSNTATQFGLRFMPTPKIDLDLIFGHNLNGEDASWITLGVNFRF